MSVVSQYIDVPVSSRIGSGCYTYKVVFDAPETGVIKIEIFANTVESAIAILASNYYPIANWVYVSNEVVAVTFQYGITGSCLLYI